MCTAQRVDQVDEGGFSLGSGREIGDGIAPLLNIQVVKPNPYKAGIQLNLRVEGKLLTMEPMHSKTTEKALDVLRMLFACYGLPKELVMDNGP